MEALANTHLYGRHLVIDYGAEDDTVEALQERTRAQFEDKE